MRQTCIPVSWYQLGISLGDKHKVMKMISDEQRYELLRLVVETNYLYCVQMGLAGAHMHPDEILSEFRIAYDDYSAERVEILKARLSELQSLAAVTPA